MEDATALVTGITGQDGQLAAQMLLSRGYRVVGTSRKGVGPPGLGVDVVKWNMLDQEVIDRTIDVVKPTEVYNFAACSSGAGMFDNPIKMTEINGLAVTKILEAIRQFSPDTRFCQASSSELFGHPATCPQNEQTPLNPRSPYGAAKMYAHIMIGIYRVRYSQFACSAILFNHESTLRGAEFVTRKVARAAAQAKFGLIDKFPIGNLDARRDWGFAGDTVDAMWRMLQAEEPRDYVVATGRTHSVRELCQCAFAHAGLDYRDYVVEDPSAFRASETVQLVGDATKAARMLDWRPTMQFERLVHMMVDAEITALLYENNNRDAGEPAKR